MSEADKKPEAAGWDEAQFECAKDLVSIPSLLAQMISQDYLPQATKLILKSEQRIKKDPKGLLKQVSDEVAVFKQKLLRKIEVNLRNSYQSQTTATLLRLQVLLGVPKALANDRLLEQRALAVRKSALEQVVSVRAVQPLIKPLLDAVILNAMEFKELDIPFEEWVYCRYSEVRKLVKALFSSAKGTKAGATSWLDHIITLDQLITNFNTQLCALAALEPLCVADIMNRYISSQSDEVAHQLIVFCKDGMLNQKKVPLDRCEDLLNKMKARLGQVNFEVDIESLINSAIQKFKE